MPETKQIDTGIAQLSVLGALLFILYIKDIDKVIYHSIPNLFADGTVLTATADTYKEAADKINSDLQNLYKWMCMNKLQINMNNPKYICFNSSKHADEISHNIISVNGEAIERVINK